MAEFCLGCWNRLNELRLTEKEVVMSKDLDLCEGCGEDRPVIVRCKRRGAGKERPAQSSEPSAPPDAPSKPS